MWKIILFYSSMYGQSKIIHMNNLKDGQFQILYEPNEVAR